MLGRRGDGFEWLLTSYYLFQHVFPFDASLDQGCFEVTEQSPYRFVRLFGLLDVKQSNRGIGLPKEACKHSD